MLRRDFIKSSAILPILGMGLPLEAFASNTSKETGLKAAFYYAYTLYEFARNEQKLAKCLGTPGNIGKVTMRNYLANDTSRQVTAPNNDTIYSSCFFDLVNGPVEIVSPDGGDRYFSIVFMDAFTDCFAYIGTRATHGKGGRYWLAGPSWKGKVPDDVTLFKSTTNDVWMLARILVDSPEDLDAAKAFQQKIQIIIPENYPPARGYQNAATDDIKDATSFLTVVNEMLRRSPVAAGQTLRAKNFAAYGIGPNAKLPSKKILAQWDALIPQGIKQLREAFLFHDLVVDGWSYQPRGVGNFGKDDYLRATVALGGLAALTEDEAMYFHCNFDNKGERLSGQNSYIWRIPPEGVPVNAFWSLTIYEGTPDGRWYLIKNPINRYSIGNRTQGLIREKDGSIIIRIQNEKPDGDMAANWLPSTKEAPIRLALRAYLPKNELIERKWRVPPIIKA
ncbi:DUF1254 domain-containing protein [Pseudaquidulcibacter saccharophilus]|uniref:DUF1254 domain-containing protein n=1 Tax=Pseudaquidulcibacter saccharophilus TaxID=2831900 RepID=UPI001EFF4722|nr:DUF1254 domain-containing protein [Pseudaquidulcibacter saccharophilus]